MATSRFAAVRCASSFLRNVFCEGANVPSSNAALYANEGLPPLPAPTCPEA